MIEQLVMYEVSKGNCKKLEKEDLDTFTNKFAYYKRLIRTGDITYERLQKDILTKYGITKPLWTPTLPVMPGHTRELASPEEQKAKLESIKKMLDILAPLPGDKVEWPKSIRKGESDIDWKNSIMYSPMKKKDKPYRWYQRAIDKVKLFCANWRTM